MWGVCVGDVRVVMRGWGEGETCLAGEVLQAGIREVCVAITVQPSEHLWLLLDHLLHTPILTGRVSTHQPSIVCHRSRACATGTHTNSND